MNNSKLSRVTSSKNAFTATQTRAPKPFRNDVGWPYKRVVEIDRLEEVADHRRGTWEAEGRLWREVNQPDLGLWLLLYGSANRHDQWERLRRAPYGDFGAHQNRCQYPSRFIKRGCDIIGSLCLLIVLLPVLLLLAIVIKMDSPGPVFFRHNRVGKDGKPFVLWKFRSMRKDVPAYETSPRSAVDSRLTRVGRIMRRLSFDELPQLINVLKGEMSLVGPRPEMPFIVASYHPIECERLAARPGITGLWQISPARAFPIHENLQYDLHYIRNQNFFLDCAIVFRTIAAVVRGVGAI